MSLRAKFYRGLTVKRALQPCYSTFENIVCIKIERRAVHAGRRKTNRNIIVETAHRVLRSHLITGIMIVLGARDRRNRETNAFRARLIKSLSLTKFSVLERKIIILCDVQTYAFRNNIIL